MAVGVSSYTADAWLDALCNATSFSVATPYLKLHVGDPGALGTSSPAVETTRKTVSFGLSASGAVSNDVEVQWATISGSEDSTFFTLWDDPTAGNFLGSGTVTANPYTAGDTFTIPVGDLDLSLTVAS